MLALRLSCDIILLTLTLLKFILLELVYLPHYCFIKQSYLSDNPRVLQHYNRNKGFRLS